MRSSLVNSYWQLRRPRRSDLKTVDNQMYHHVDVLQELNRNIPLAEKLGNIHRVLQQRYRCIQRIAVATYDRNSDLLTTFVDSSGPDAPLAHYQARLAEARSLREILDQRRPRVLQNLGVFGDSSHEHTLRIREHGYKASYTLPMFLNGVFFGFVFFNSDEEHPFDPELLHYLDIFGHLIALVVSNEISAIQTLLGVVRTARDITHHRDTETGTHLDRMARYALLIAQELADKYALADEFIQYVYLFAPLHDIGKIAIPDWILLKPDKLSMDEYAVMKTHTSKGREIIDQMMQSFNLGTFQHIDVLRNIAEFHHEAVNGSGYPNGLKGNAIPLEARIVAVADVFDALTSRRPYKEPWSNEEAFANLHRLAGSKFDRDCVEALQRQESQIEIIQAQFREDAFG